MNRTGGTGACGDVGERRSGRGARRTALLALAVVLAEGCVMGASYRRPVIDVPDTFRGQNAPASASLADLPWWEVFKDDALKALVTEALARNDDMRIAVSRMEQARAVTIQTRASLFPELGYEGDATRGKNAALGKAIVNQGQTGSDFLASLNAAWDLDLWGRLRRLDEAARAEYLASEEARRAVALSLLAAVAQAYFELLDLDRRMEIAKRSVDSFGQSLKIFTERFKGGVASRLETARAEAALASVAATIPQLERAIALQEDAIGVLLGQNPTPIARSSALLDQAMPADVPAGLPSALLERRPDLREGEAYLRSANAQLGAAKAEFLPRIALTALGGGISTELSDLSDGRSAAWSVGLSVSGPLYQAGRASGVYRQAKAAREEAALRYRQAAVNAFREVSDALVTREKLKDIRVQQERSVDAYREAVKVSMERYQAGRAAYYEVLEAQQQLFPAENALADTQRDQLLALVQLYKALGGGW